jgi:competence protein ComEA
MADPYGGGTVGGTVWTGSPAPRADAESGRGVAPRRPVPHRLALAAALALVLAAPRLRSAVELPPQVRACAPEGRGAPPRHWLGCAVDPGPPRALAGDERLLLGLPLDLNAAEARELAFVPGLSPRLAAEVVADRAARGAFGRVEDLERVRGVGPKRLARARAHLIVHAP